MLLIACDSFALKERNKPAQGIALGLQARLSAQALKGRHHCCAFSGLHKLAFAPRPRALPWAVMFNRFAVKKRAAKDGERFPHSK